MMKRDSERPKGSASKAEAVAVGTFFDSISKAYTEKYDPAKNRFLAHFFRQRLVAAVAGVPTTMGRVLDIGSGTGQLFAFLQQEGFGFGDFWAVDISAGMLEQSPVPPDRRVVGTVHSASLDPMAGSFDHFFMLGVTTYMSRAEVVAAFQRIRELAAPDATFVCTFTNRGSIEYVVHTSLSFVLHRLKRLTGLGTSAVAAQGFSKFIISEEEMRELVSSAGRIERVSYLNHTLTPINRMMPRLSIAVERLTAKLFSENVRLMRLFSSDIMFHVNVDHPPLQG